MDNDVDFGLRIADIGKPLGQILLEAGLIDQDQLDEILDLQAKAHAKGEPKEVGEFIVDRYGIPRTIIDGFFIREQLLFTIRDLFYSTLTREAGLPADELIDATELILLSWESEMTETINYKESTASGAQIARESKLQWVRGDILFKVGGVLETPLEIRTPFSYTPGNAPEIDLFAIVYEIRLHFFNYRSSEDT